MSFFKEPIKLRLSLCKVDLIEEGTGVDAELSNGRPSGVQVYVVGGRSTIENGIINNSGVDLSTPECSKEH